MTFRRGVGAALAQIDAHTVIDACWIRVTADTGAANPGAADAGAANPGAADAGANGRAAVIATTEGAACDAMDVERKSEDDARGCESLHIGV